jgi:hypothetical protein
MNEALLGVLLTAGRSVALDKLRTAIDGLPAPVTNLVMAEAGDAVDAAIKAVLELLEPDHVVLRSSGPAEVRVHWDKSGK